MLDITEKVKELLSPIISEEGIELVEINVKKRKRGYLLRIFIDKQGGISINDCENVSEQLSRILDVEDIFPGSFILEVSSPGIDRPLKTPADFKRCLGRLVNISTCEAVEEKVSFIGKILEVTSDGVLLELEGEERSLEIPFPIIAKASQEIRF
ncbi:MAG: hypothetical protein A2042_08360 [Candidatus Schekmanbacteria bacterium GWA2_38_11]|uniref:Ribosome maturation factor RimP n=1 Tax=Candidatus Schekmanbacteria bacterium GWA2_38_11 TaxID=1817876 RepID=A0A1F7RFB7_9BACT|nr:MAG: hypothetical protein A2042_08360 [Candidatus Schekmanbacteria bacterium GWA2_38_11]